MKGLNKFSASLTLIHSALMMGVCIMGIILYFYMRPEEGTEVNLPFNEMLFLILGIIPWMGSRFLYRSGIAKAAQETDIMKKLSQFQSTFIISNAIGEGMALVSMVLYFAVFPVSALLVVTLISLVSMLLLRPSPNRIKKELELDEADLQRLFKEGYQRPA